MTGRPCATGKVVYVTNVRILKVSKMNKVEKRDYQERLLGNSLVGDAESTSSLPNGKSS